jgi:hypothetical protein
MAWGFMPVELWKTLTEKEKELFILERRVEASNVRFFCFFLFFFLFFPSGACIQ